MAREFKTMGECPEVAINNYAMFMYYLSLAVRGLGYLVLTWTTVILLGGFVSMLNQKDFWSLTVITLVQTVGVLDVSANERLSNIGYSFFGLLVLIFPSTPGLVSPTRLIAGMLAALVQVLVFVLVLCPLGAAYKIGLVISTGHSMWRVIQQDYVDALDPDPNKKNLRPALNVLYSLALFQGGLYMYRAIFSTKHKPVADYKAEQYQLDDKARLEVKEYFRKTRVGLEKDPSFTRDWNLVPYAVRLLEDRSPRKYRSGVRILDFLLRRAPSLFRDKDEDEDEDEVDWYKQLLRFLLGSPSAGNIISKLLWTLDSAKPFGKQAREHATTIVVFIAAELHLEQFPRGLRQLASLLDVSKTKTTAEL